jgi:DNA integrity scanning protein DisA with diadenylate cyclase activity
MISIKDICGTKEDCYPRVLESTIQLAVEIAREGREGRKIGTLFVVGDEKETLRRSKNLILDPLRGHPYRSKEIGDPEVRETIKELAQLDGAFIVSASGIVMSAARHINTSVEGINLPLGLGSRHMAAASISRETEAVAIVVSKSAVVRVFNGGHIVAEILPEFRVSSNASIKIKETQQEGKTTDLKIVNGNK